MDLVQEFLEHKVGSRYIQDKNTINRILNKGCRVISFSLSSISNDKPCVGIFSHTVNGYFSVKQVVPII